MRVNKRSRKSSSFWMWWLIAEGVTNNTFALVLRRRDDSFDTARAYRLLEQSGADHIEEKVAEL